MDKIHPQLLASHNHLYIKKVFAYMVRLLLISNCFVSFRNFHILGQCHDHRHCFDLIFEYDCATFLINKLIK